MILGFCVLLAAGICQGSFGLGYKKYDPFSWAAFWGVYNILCVIISALFAWAAAPKLWEIFSAGGFAYWSAPLACGALWGLSAVAFSKGIDKIGMSMVYGISMGISTISGSVTPMLISRDFPSGASAVSFLIGLLLTLAGVGIVTAAGVKRDGGAKGSVSGIALALLSGLGSGAMNVGFARSESISAEFIRLGYSGAAVSSGRWLPVLFGGCMAGLLWCIGELFVKREWKTVSAKGSAKRTLKLLCVSVIWYAALLLYGLSSAMLGDMGSTAGWILFNSLALIISVGWGLKTGEWKGSKKNLLFAGCAVLIAAWGFTALS